MGTDIHPYFEKLIEDKWTCYPFVPKLHPEYWYEPLFYAKEAYGPTVEKAIIKFCDPEPKSALEKFEEWCEKLPYDEACELFGNNPHVHYAWGMPYNIRSRNYEYFALLSGIRGTAHETIQKEYLGIPDDCCDEIMREYEQAAGDAHTPSWIIVSELIDNPAINSQSNVLAVREYFESINDNEYDKIRMVFWYDN